MSNDYKAPVRRYLEEQQPRIADSFVYTNTGTGFVFSRYVLANVTTLRQFYDLIKRALQPLGGDVFVTVRFSNADNPDTAPLFRSVAPCLLAHVRRVRRTHRGFNTGCRHWFR